MRRWIARFIFLFGLSLFGVTITGCGARDEIQQPPPEQMEKMKQEVMESQKKAMEEAMKKRSQGPGGFGGRPGGPPGRPGGPR